MALVCFWIYSCPPSLAPMLQARRSLVRIPMPLVFFSWPNPSSHTMALESTQPLTDVSTRNLPGGKGQPAHKADSLTAICEPTVWKMWEPWHFTTLWTSMASYRNSFTFLPFTPHLPFPLHSMFPFHSLRKACENVLTFVVFFHVRLNIVWLVCASVHRPELISQWHAHNMITVESLLDTLLS
jgi:hypothetical protein